MKFKHQTFVDVRRLDRDERWYLNVARNALARLREAGEETGLLTREQVRQQGCCVFAASALVEALQKSGFDASLLACGLAFARTHNGRIQGKLIGSPEAEDAPFPGAIDGHAVVRLGGFILDPTFGQLSDGIRKFPDTVILAPLKTRKRIDLVNGIDAEQFAEIEWRTGRRGYFVGLFELPVALEAAASMWSSDPSVDPELLRPLVQRTLELVNEPPLLDASKRSKGWATSPARISRIGPRRRHTAAVPELPQCDFRPNFHHQKE